MTLHEYIQQYSQRGACMCGKCIDAPDNKEYQGVNHRMWDRLKNIVLMDYRVTFLCDGCLIEQTTNVRSTNWRLYCSKTNRLESIILPIGA